MIANNFKELFLRDLDRLLKECNLYPSEEELWIKVDGINNTAGNLIMHLCGNLQHFIGAVLNESGYQRNRDFEFKGKLSIEDLRTEIEATKSQLALYFERHAEDTFSGTYPLELFGYSMTIHYFLIHLQGHLNYHLGQINYHRRILANS